MVVGAFVAGSALDGASVACTSCSVTTTGATCVTIVAVSASPSFNSPMRIARPPLKIWMPRSSNWPCVNCFRTPSASRTITELGPALNTTPSRISVTATSLIVVVVVMVAVPFIPGFKSDTAIFLPSTVKRKSSGTVISCVPFSSRTTSLFPSTATTSKLRVPVVVVVCPGRNPRRRAPAQPRRLPLPMPS
jgi:hypothetical protein